MEKLGEAGEERADVDRKSGTRMSHELADYAATYRHPAYGDAVIRVGDDGAVRELIFVQPQGNVPATKEPDGGAETELEDAA